MSEPETQILMSLPPATARYLRQGGAAECAAVPESLKSPNVFVSHDPEGRPLGSGGGTVHLLAEAYAAEGGSESLEAWLAARQRLILHAGGLSRRLPAYSSAGKAMIPIPLRRETPFARLQQTLCDFQIPLYERALAEAGPKASVLLSSGDVWLDLDPMDIPPVASDICGVGMDVSPEVASHFGVFFVPRGLEAATAPPPVAFFLQKPSPETIYSYLDRYRFLVDTGLWFLSARAVKRLFDVCRWSSDAAGFETADGYPASADFYSDICVGFGSESTCASSLGSDLSVSTVVLEQARFYHLGTSRQVFESLDGLQTNRARLKKQCYSSLTPQVTPPALREHGAIWTDTYLPEAFPRMAGDNILTLIPEQATLTDMAKGWCLDTGPVGDAFAFRPYHIDDTFRGTAESGAVFCGRPLSEWCSRRGIQLPAAQDIARCDLFPLVAAGEINQAWLEWFFAETPAPALSERYGRLPRISQVDLARRLNGEVYFACKCRGLRGSLTSVLERLSEGRDPSLFDFDFAQFATLVNEQFPDLRETAVAALEGVRATAVVPEHTMRYERFLECLGAGRAPGPGRGNAFARLSSTVRSFHGRAEGLPRAAMKPDQIVWAHSPVRLDLAGGWTDTPPYCFEEGGAVLNVAVNLNGQAPVQVFVRPSRDPVIRFNSIDLGVSEIVTSFEELEAYCDLSSAFSLPRAALCLLGFHPGFGASQPTLQAALEAFGGGLDISLLCAVPKGSGLGTSSILAATLIQGLASACGLPWDRLDVYRKVLALEQMLTSGGGWQDQAGVLFPGLKLIETEPGHAQVPIVRSLPDALLGAAMSERRLLLYYTGVTRLAKNILQDIVDHMILRESSTRRLLGDIRGNALRMFDVLQRSDEPGLIRCLRRSWALNRALDADTTSPAINDMIDRCGTDLAACKLLGAGGGGYLLLLAHEVAGGRRLRRALDDNPPNDRARFVDVSISHRGTQVTHS